MGGTEKGLRCLSAILFPIAFLCLLVLQAVPVEQVVRGFVCGGAHLQELRG